MEQVDKIIKVLKTGEGKKGHWELLQIKTTTGKLATGFGLAEGDDVLLEYNQDYKNYSAKKIEKRQSDQEPEVTVTNTGQGELIKALAELTEALRYNAKLMEKAKVEEVFEPTEEELNSEPPF